MPGCARTWVDRVGAHLRWTLPLIRREQLAEPPGWQDKLEAACARDRRLLHGDASGANALVLDDGSLVLLDPPGAISGPREADVGHIVSYVACVGSRTAEEKVTEIDPLLRAACEAAPSLDPAAIGLFAGVNLLTWAGYFLAGHLNRNRALPVPTETARGRSARPWLTLPAPPASSLKVIMADGPIGRHVVLTRLGPVTLATDEELVSIEPSPVVLPERTEPPLSVLLRMASAGSEADLGASGPVIASLANEENSGNPELRRYEAVYGRDALYTAAFLRHIYPRLEEGTIRYFSAYQAVRSDPLSLAAPGKIAHHIRDPSDPIAQQLTAETRRRWPWYGGTDTTVLFLIACAHAVARDPALLDEEVVYPLGHPQAGTLARRGGAVLTIRAVVREAAQWLRRELQRPPMPGLLWCWLNRKDSYTVWTDSPNSFHFGNGVIPSPPVAPTQLQAEVYDAASGIASLAASDPALRLDAGVFAGLAARVRRLILDRAVVEHPLGPYLAAGLVADQDKQLRALDVRTAGMGMALDSDLLACPDAAWLRQIPASSSGSARDDVTTRASGPGARRGAVHTLRLPLTGMGVRHPPCGPRPASVWAHRPGRRTLRRHHPANP